MKRDTLEDFEKWWAEPKPVNWLQFPMAQKQAAKAAWDAREKLYEKEKWVNGYKEMVRNLS